MFDQWLWRCIETDSIYGCPHQALVDQNYHVAHGYECVLGDQSSTFVPLRRENLHGATIMIWLHGATIMIWAARPLVALHQVFIMSAPIWVAIIDQLHQQNLRKF